MFGLDDRYPKPDSAPSKELIEEEANHLLGIIDMLTMNGILDKERIFSKEGRAMKYSRSRGILKEEY